MPKKPFNKYGEIDVSVDSISIEFPFEYSNAETLEEVNEKYEQKINELIEDPTVDEDIYLIATDISEKRDRISLEFDGNGLLAFTSQAKKLTFHENLYLYRDLVKLGKNATHTEVNWNPKNFVLDLSEKRVKAMYFDFGIIPIFNTKKALDGVVSVIILSQTNLKQYFGKPKRTDFVEPENNDIILFVEEIIKANDLDDIEQSIEERIIAFEQQLQEEERIREEKKANSVFYRAVSKLPALPSSKKNRNEIQGDPYEGEIIERNQSTSKLGSFFNSNGYKKFQSKYIYVAISAIALIILVAFAFSNNGDDEEVASESQEENPAAYSENVNIAYREARSNNNEEALSILEDIEYDNLEEEDQSLMVDLYVQTGQEAEAIELNPAAADQVINQYIAENRESDLAGLNEETGGNNPALAFEVAVQNQEWETALEQVNDLELNGRKEKDIVTAYARSGQMDQATAFIEEVGNPDLNGTVTAIQEQNQQRNELETARQELAELDSELEELDEDADERDDVQDERDDKASEIERLKAEVES